MLIRLKLIGSGEPGDSYRVSLPTYQMIDVDYKAQTALVNVPDADIPETIAPTLKSAAKTAIDAPKVAGMMDMVHAAWGVHLDTRYEEHKGRFRPEVV
jgi:hypothetical protein